MGGGGGGGGVGWVGSKIKITGTSVDSLRGGLGVQISPRVFRVPTEETKKKYFAGS